MNDFTKAAKAHDAAVRADERKRSQKRIERQGEMK